MRATATITIARPIDDVFAYIADVEHMDEWVVGVGDTQRVSGDDTGVGDTGVGATYESTYTYGGRTHVMHFEVTRYEAPTRFGITAPEGPFAFDGLLECEETPEGTRVTNTIETGADGTFTKMLFTVFRPLMHWLMARQLEKELRELKTILETTPEPSGESLSVRASGI